MKKITLYLSVLLLLACQKESVEFTEQVTDYPVQFEFHNLGIDTLARVEFLTYILYRNDNVRSGILKGVDEILSNDTIAIEMDGSEIESVVREGDLAWANVYVWQKRKDGLFDEMIWIPRTKTVDSKDPETRLYTFNWPSDTIDAKLYSRKIKQYVNESFRSYPGYRYEQINE